VSQLLSVPTGQEIIAASLTGSASISAAERSDAVQNQLNALLTALENEKTEKQAIIALHDLADQLAACDASDDGALTIKSVGLPSLSAPIRLLLTPAVFSPELWGRTFAEGLLKNKEQFHGKKVVEVGTGSGWISLLLLFVTNVKEIHGLDLNPVAITMARLNTWLNGTTKDGAYILSMAGDPIVKAFSAEVSDLLGVPLKNQQHYDHVIGCIPQVLHPSSSKNEQLQPATVSAGQNNLSERGLTDTDLTETDLTEKDLYDLSNYCFEQGILEDRFGLPLIARALEQAQLCLNPGGKVTLVLGGRPGRQAIESMFDRRGYESKLVWMRRIQQADDTDLVSLVDLEGEHGIRFHFFMSRDSEYSVSAATAVKLLASGRQVFHDLLVYQADTRFEPEVFDFVRNLRQLNLESLRKELDFSRLGHEKISFLSRLSRSLLAAKTIPYPHERADMSLRSILARYLQGFCYYPITAEELFIAPSRPELVDMLLRMLTAPEDRLLLSSSLFEVYGKICTDNKLDVTVGNDDLSELNELDNLVAPKVVLIAPRQLLNASPINFKAICKQARLHPERWYIVDDSESFSISSALGTNMTLRFAGQEPLPENLVFLYGLIKNTISRDLELSFLVNAPHAWLEGLDIGAELSYSRIAYPTQLLYEWLFDDLMTFPFADQSIDERVQQNAIAAATTAALPASSLIASLAKDPVFAAKPVDLNDPELIRLDYGEFEAPVPDILVKGLLKGFLDDETAILPQIVSERVAAYLKWTRKVSVSGKRIVLAQGVFPLFGAIIKAMSARLGRPCLVAVPDGSYGPLYPMLSYYGARVIEIKTSAEKAFVLSTRDLSSLSEKPDLLWLTQPNNPSGIFLDPERLRNVIEACHKQDIYVFSDEIFFLLSDHRLGKWTPSSLSAGSFATGPWASHIFMADGIAKSFAAGGMRCGFMMTPDDQWAEEIAAHVAPPPVAILRAWDALYSAFLEKSPHQMLDVTEAFGEIETYLTQQRKVLSSRREELLTLLKAHNLDDGYDTPYRGGLFVLARLDSAFKQLAVEKKLLVNPGEWARTCEMVRICFCIDENSFKETMKRLTEFLEKA
jgi:aspartate/methionine/tyrosine aminotransferase